MRDGAILAPITQVPSVVRYVLRSFYQSTGYENVATTLSVLEGAVFMIPIFYALSRVGIFAMALAYAIATVLSLVVVVVWMQRRARLSGCGSFLTAIIPFISQNSFSHGRGEKFQGWGKIF